MIRRRHSRSGFSLLEVMLAMAIFLIALAGIAQLMNLTTEQAMEIHDLNRAGQLLQSKMNEVIAGAVALNSVGDTPVDDEPNWTWAMDCEEDATADLYHVTVRVTRKDAQTDESRTWTLSQIVLDPAARGTIEAPPTAAPP